MEGFMVIVVLFLAICVICVFIDAFLKFKNNRQIEKAKRELDPVYNELYNGLKQKYNEYLNRPEYKKIEYPTITTKEITLCFGDVDLGHTTVKFDLWRNDENLCCISNWTYLNILVNAAKDVVATFQADETPYKREQDLRQRFNKWNHLKVLAFYIPLNSIEYFAMGGQKYVTTEVTGGGGTVGGSSVTGAIIGGMVAGGAGAVIGSRKESTINPIQTHTVVHNETEAYIKYREQDGTLKEIVSGANADSFFNALRKIIPEKEYSYVLSQNLAKTQPVVEEKNSIEDRLVKAKELLEKGLISQEEYEKKRQDILSEM